MNSLYTVNVFSGEIFKKKVLGFKTFVTISHCGHCFNTGVAKGNEPFWNHSITLNEKNSFALVFLNEKGVFSDDVIGEGVVMLKQNTSDLSIETKVPLFYYNKKIAEVTLKIEDLMRPSFRNSRKISKLPSSNPLPELKSAQSDPQYIKNKEEFKIQTSEKPQKPKTPPLSLITYGVQLKDIEFDQMIYTSQSGKQEVFIGKIVSLGKKIVIKVSHCEDNEEFNIVQREAMSISQLSHPNICQVYGTLLDTSAGKLKNLIILEFCEGRPLRKVIESRHAAGISFSEAEVLSLLKQLISAFAHIQSKKIIHSDIKPDNIVLSDDGISKIIDFGMSLTNYSDIFETAKTLKVGGTILYFSPLQIRAYLQYIQGQNPECTVKHNPLKSDVFSLGLSFIHLTTMNPPLGLNNFDSELQSRLSNVISRLNYSDFIKGIISDMLTVDENLRPDFFELINKIKY
jgi:hypothetical protein